MIFFSGGKPGYLAQVLRASPLWEAIEALLARGGVAMTAALGRSRYRARLEQSDQEQSWAT